MGEVLNFKNLSRAFVVAGTLSAHAAEVDAKGHTMRGLNCNELVDHGKASWYKSGKVNADQSKFHPDQVSVAHKSLPFGTVLKIESVDPDVTGSVVAEVKDRGPYKKGRVVDLSSGAANYMEGLKAEGVAKVNVYKCTPQ